MRTDKIIWLDGHTSTIDSEEAFRCSEQICTDNGYKYILKYANSEFIWIGGCWMEM